MSLPRMFLILWNLQRRIKSSILQGFSISSRNWRSSFLLVQGNCSVVIQRILPQKFKDPGSVTISCAIRMVSIGKALIDIGASINLMPLSMCWRIRNLKIVLTRKTLQLAYCSIIIPYGVVEDVLVKVQQFTFLVDLVIMDIEEDLDVPLILGRTFMLTTKCVVDMGNGGPKGDLQSL